VERKEAIYKLNKLLDKELHQLALDNNVRLRNEAGQVNKGWAGHTIERYLGLPLNSSQSPNFGSWELKVVALKKLRNNTWNVKETMAVTMIDPINVMNTPFEDSHLFMKLRKIVMVVRTVGSDVDELSYVKEIATIDLEDRRIFNQVRDDYELVRRTLKDNKNGFELLTGSMGVYIQPRTKGSGHGSTSRAFYARTQFLRLFIKSI